MSARIVVLDPEPVVREVLAKILKTAGYSVEAIDTYEAALEILTTAPPDLVLTNVYLPGIPAREAVRNFKNIHPGVPVLMVSGLPDEDVIQGWAGHDGFDTFPT